MSESTTSSLKADRKRLYEISVIRPLIILSLVLNHAFVKIAVGGARRNDYQLPDLYQWINYFNFEATLELFVLISGYLFAFQLITLNRNYSFKEFAIKKVRRLLLPMLAFGVVYYFCFLFDIKSFTIADFLMKLLSGCGHLWFLPMLFWCLLILWTLVRYNLNGQITLSVLALLSLIKYLPISFGLATVTHYLFYAFLGYYLYQHKKEIISFVKENKWIIIILWFVYLMFVYLDNSSLSFLRLSDSLFSRFFLYASSGIFRIIACVSGVLVLYSTVSLITTSESFQLKPIIQKADKISFGVYIYHQYILVALYHYTSIVLYFNAWLVPWVGFSVALLASSLLTSLTLRTKIGRYLIG